ncbi:acyl--CoA ligase [Sporobolomyces koalae]|uniref:acyl--CoA ligase n=1 Tax=Sporobolomyces koalae TaxID=500713 RepID=UPI00316C7FD5
MLDAEKRRPKKSLASARWLNPVLGDQNSPSDSALRSPHIPLQFHPFSHPNQRSTTMTIYRSTFEPVPETYVGGVFEFIFGSSNPNYDPKSIALIDGPTGNKTTYAQLRESSLEFASGFTSAAGLKRRDTILIFAPNSVLYPALVFGGQAAGLVVSTANSSYTATELAHQVELASAKILLVGADLVNVAKAAAKECGIPEGHIYVLPGVDGKLPTQLEGLRSYEELKGSKSFKPVEYTEAQVKNELAILPFSSGTTGKAKGVMLSVQNITSCVQQTIQTKDLFDQKDTMLAVLPMYHIFGLVVTLHLTLYNGGTMCILPKFDLALALELIQKYKCTAACLVPPIILGIAKHPIVDKYDLSSLRYILSGAAPLSADLQQAVSTRLKGKTKVVQGWGMTETTSVGLIPTLTKPVPTGSVGQLLSGVEARLVDASGRDVKEGEAGELWVRGPNIMLGYMRNEKSTRETINDEGWLLSGDVCERDKNGFFRITERVKELIKYKGFQVAPAELEGVLLNCPSIGDAAVIGVWSEEQATELPRAYIVPAPNADKKTVAEEARKWVESKLAPHKRLRGGVYVLETIPKLPSGKILRKDLRTMAAKEDKTNSRL